MCCSKIPSSLFRTSNWVKKASRSRSPSASARLFSRSARPSRTSGWQILFPASCHQARHNWLCMRHWRTARVNQIKIRMNGFILPLVVLLPVLDQAKKKSEMWTVYLNWMVLVAMPWVAWIWLIARHCSYYCSLKMQLWLIFNELWQQRVTEKKIERWCDSFEYGKRRI